MKKVLYFLFRFGSFLFCFDPFLLVLHLGLGHRRVDDLALLVPRARVLVGGRHPEELGARRVVVPVVRRAVDGHGAHLAVLALLPGRRLLLRCVLLERGLLGGRGRSGGGGLLLLLLLSLLDGRGRGLLGGLLLRHRARVRRAVLLGLVLGGAPAVHPGLVGAQDRGVRGALHLAVVLHGRRHLHALAVLELVVLRVRAVHHLAHARDEVTPRLLLLGRLLLLLLLTLVLRALLRLRLLARLLAADLLLQVLGQRDHQVEALLRGQRASHLHQVLQRVGLGCDAHLAL